MKKYSENPENIVADDLWSAKAWHIESFFMSSLANIALAITLLF